MANVFRSNKRTGVIPSGIKDNTSNPITANGDHTISGLSDYEGVKINVNVGASPALQQKTITAGTTAQTVQPDTGYDGFSAVTINPTPSETKSATPTTSAQTITPSSGKLLSSVSVSAIQTQTKTVTATTSSQDVTPDTGKFLSKVTVSPQSHSGDSTTYTSNGRKDLGDNHNIRYVNIDVPQQTAGYNMIWELCSYVSGQTGYYTEVTLQPIANGDMPVTLEYYKSANIPHSFDNEFWRATGGTLHAKTITLKKDALYREKEGDSFVTKHAGDTFTISSANSKIGACLIF